MTDPPASKPRPVDAVLGGHLSAPSASAVLGGLAGIQQRLSSPIAEQRVAALSQAMRQGDMGLDWTIAALRDESAQVQQAAYDLLRDHPAPKAQSAVQLFVLTSIQQQFNSAAEADRLNALRDALQAGDPGLDLVLQFLPTASDTCQRVAYEHLRDRPEPRVQKVLELFSSSGISYWRLRSLLLSRQWRQGDQETLRLILLACGHPRPDPYPDSAVGNDKDVDSPVGMAKLKASPALITHLPCEDLQMLDRLWVTYSKGRFGFSVQQSIWQPLHNLFWNKADVWSSFGDRVGWRINHLLNPNHWKRYSEITFSGQAPKGHLPFLGGEFGIFTVEAFSKRLTECDRD